MLAEHDEHQAIDFGFVQEAQRKLRLSPAFGQLEVACEAFYWLRVQPALLQSAARGLGIGGSEGDAHQPLAVSVEKLAEIVGLPGLNDAAQFQIISLEHDAPIAGAPLDVAAARRHDE